MLIRSQDKMHLIDISGKHIRENAHGCIYISDDVVGNIGNSLLIGQYTLERAIEVLDEIQYDYENSLFTDDDGISLFNIVYHMPEE